MAKPIKLNEYGETLNGYPDISDERELELECCVGTHGVHCRGFMDIQQVSETHQALTCRRCNFRLLLPISVRTYGDLRKVCGDG